MKLNCWILFGTMLSTSLLAQQVTNPPPTAPIETPAPAPALPETTNAPALPPLTPPPAPEARTSAPVETKPAARKKAAPKKQVKKKTPAFELKTVPLVAGTAVVIASNVNVRGQAKLNSEVITRLTKGQEVTVLTEVVRTDSGPEEPSAWAKILLPANTHVWVHSSFVEATNKTVAVNKLNLRGGPGENYSILGQLQRGEPVKELTTKGDWIQIDAPTNAFGFIAAQYLKQEAPAAPVVEAPAVAATEPTNAPTPATVAEAPTVAAAPTEPPVTPAPETPAVTNAPAAAAAPAETPAVTNEVAAVPAQPVAEEPPPKRIVQREGVVRGTRSIQAPTRFELFSPETGRSIDYLYATHAELDLSRYKGLRVIVTGEEGLEERWGNTPVITIQKLQVLE